MRDITTTLLYRWFHEVWNQSQEQTIDELLSPDCYAHGINAEDGAKGIEGFKAFYQDFQKQFQHIQINIKDVISQDDMECAHTEVTAIHRKTGTPVKFSGLCLVRIENGKIEEAWNHYDFLNMHQQLGQELTPLELA
ncbi:MULTISPECIES: ester cyclase [Niastella]|uniref:Ester cyclase n=1 Tax=Niastella soli TaxID=2821487 RepID=A0ABS3YNQ8_9BACT|nr:ester cyclase [Niastella soli]MBO9198896.1 ester cyclase [Niastella soli]